MLYWNNFYVAPIDFMDHKRPGETVDRPVIIVLSSECITYTGVNDNGSVLDLPLAKVLANQRLSQCIEEMRSNGAKTWVVSAPSDLAPVRTLQKWLHAVAITALPRDDAGRLRAPDHNMVIASHNMDSFTAFLTIGLSLCAGNTLFASMAKAAHCGIDSHLDSHFLEALDEFSKSTSSR